LGTKVIICKPADPEAKGLVERLHDYLERSFLPGRRFASPQDFNSQLAAFLVRANSRQHRVLGCRPLDRVDADRLAMLALPPVPPVTGWRQLLRLPRDHYVRLDGNDYSVHPAAVGRRIVVSADLDRVRVTCDGSLVADHERLWAKHQTVSDLQHLVAAKVLRRGRIDLVRPPAQTEVEIRSLAAYDTALGIATGVEGRMG
jgi:transposase